MSKCKICSSENLEFCTSACRPNVTSFESLSKEEERRMSVIIDSIKQGNKLKDALKKDSSNDTTKS